jgi:hypothetical protein
MKKINVKILKSGGQSGKILETISYMNEGKDSFSPRDLEGYCNVTRIWLNSSYPGLTLVKDTDEPNTFHISEDGGKTFTLSLEWVEVRELSPVNDPDDMKNVLN